MYSLICNFKSISEFIRIVLFGRIRNIFNKFHDIITDAKRIQFSFYTNMLYAVVFNPMSDAWKVYLTQGTIFYKFIPWTIESFV